MKIEELNKSKTIKAVVICIAGIIIVLGILSVGIKIGEQRAKFAGGFGNNFEENFMGPRNGMGKIFDGAMPGGHGAIGEIININLPQIIISGPDKIEKIVSINEKTVIRKFQEDMKSSQLEIGNTIIVLGNPNENGIIEAKLIRIMPPKQAPAGTAATSTSVNP